MNAFAAGLSVQMLRLVNEKGERANDFPYQTHVIRYPVHQGWIVCTIVVGGSTPTISQTFVPDAEHDWAPTLAPDDQQVGDAPSADLIQLVDNEPQPTPQS